MEKYIGSIAVGAVLLVITAFIIYKLIKDKKSGKSSCGSSCTGCSRKNCSGNGHT
ncbi:MAG: FeoB-associated Cys-rich membrane protein [Butyrivibrio sp.]